MTNTDNKDEMVYGVTFTDIDIVTDKKAGVMTPEMLKKLNDLYTFFQLFSASDNKTYAIKNRKSEIVADVNDSVVTKS